MKKFIATTLIASMATLGVARAEETQIDTSLPVEQPIQEQMAALPMEGIQEETTAATTDDDVSDGQTVPQTDEKPYAHVGKASDDAVAAARSKQWQNILIAAGAVAIAITALILVHNNAGH